MSSTELTLIGLESMGHPKGMDLFGKSKILTIVGIVVPGEPTELAHHLKPSGIETESALLLPDWQSTLFIDYFRRYIGNEPGSNREGTAPLSSSRNCLGFVAFMQGWTTEGYQTEEDIPFLQPQRVPLSSSEPGVPYGFYRGESPVLTHAVIGTGIENDCLGIDGASGPLVRKSPRFITLERTCDGYNKIVQNIPEARQ